ncbi:MAG TPA: DUF2207 domain-containing protein [Acidimicrobiia bacterium]|nr:DUF2207 domain-containing protein [Acidimicrobiia bacterium]
MAASVVVDTPPSHAQTAEHISRYDSDLTIEADGGLLVRETIDYDFGTTPHHGIFRVIPVRVDYPPKENYDRVYPIDVLSVSATGGASAQYEVSEDGDDLRIRIGDPDRTVTGAHTYEITYRVRGAYNGFSDHDELVWNVVGNEWPVQIDSATATVHAPTDITQVNCSAGLYGSFAPCGAAEASGSTATFQAPQFGLGPYQGMTVTVGLPKGAVPEPVPILEERFNLASAFRATTATTSISGVLLVLILGAIGVLLFIFGRDRRARGGAVDAAFASGEADATTATGEERVPLAGEHETPVEFVPPDGLRPGQVGTLVDFKANPLDVTATIVDLAVRGYLTIEETQEKGLFRAGDWKLTRSDKTEDDLLQYERTLLHGLFESGMEVQLSELHNTFAARMTKVQTALMNDAIKRRWFAGKPSTVHALWVLAGLVLLGIGVAVTVLLAISTHAALIGVPLVIGGLALVIGARWMPHRTAKGYGVLRRVDGFRRFIDESEKERAQFAERKNLFSEYLPYAVVFGATKKWANAFAGLDDEPPDTSSWYRGAYAFNYLTFSSAIDSFSVSSAGTLTSAPSTSGSSGFSGGGFSGGGGGGGGGGSW